ncbi:MULTISPECIES: FAD/NAD(P)-binding protein [unclassified Rhizobium]|uniref:FAD/NAD(P)-binding protein n=1 Tax=unclassified Rhizobium TaxID=2613769 RepID=UPI000CDF3970|nr:MULTISPECIES: FAD/NAD(P)-binding protein [Rhizobium]AVA21944.1 FAD-NAD(P)-binding domain-containing protein [Rhizobium sp. NXC24]UWU22991.1 FAD/NAD(P)-binding protein [Rhizobium tropici]
MTVQGLFSARANASAQAYAMPRIAVIGRGFSGMMTAIALMKTVRTPFHLQLFDPNSSVSGGQALASGHSSEILNSRVRDLSVSAGDPDDFNDWLCSNAAFRSAVPAAIPGFLQIFVPKSIFSDYVYQRFSEALSSRRDIAVQVSGETVIGLRRSHGDRFLVESAGAVYPPFDTVVLATGYGIADHEPQSGEPVATPTTVRARRLVSRPHTVLLGSGLRVVDRLLQMRDNGYDGQITIVSRHGFLPQSHTRSNADPVFPAEAMPGSLSEIVRFIRRACENAEASGQSWQSVMNGLRKHARSLWRSLPAGQKQQFNRHLRALYDSHRNRLPEALYVRLRQELAEGNTLSRCGQFLRRTPTGLMLKPAGQQGVEQIYADEVIDCRCREPDLDTPLMRSLINAGLATQDELGLGLAVEATGALSTDGRIIEGLFAIGPLGLGSLPDIDLVPEIVTQAYAAAEGVAARFYPQCKAV